MWQVIQDKRGRYYVCNPETGQQHGTHDCERWAMAVADMLNAREENEQKSGDKVVRSGKAAPVA